MPNTNEFGNRKSSSPRNETALSQNISLASWSRQQKLALAASFSILALLIAVSACSRQSPKSALVAVPSLAPLPSVAVPPSAAPAVPSPTLLAMAKKKARKRPAEVVYTDAISGVSFLYPRKFSLTSGDTARPDLAAVGDVPMNFVQPGGVAVATVALPDGAYRGTDFASAFFRVNLNRSLSEPECSHFAFVDSRTADGEPVDAEKVQVGSAEMERTSNFSASAIKQDETQYFHSYDHGICFEYVLGLGTAGLPAEGTLEPVNRDQVFATLEKILASVKINPAAEEPIAEQTSPGLNRGKE
jgi:hypothetical protein